MERRTNRAFSFSRRRGVFVPTAPSTVSECVLQKMKENSLYKRPLDVAKCRQICMAKARNNVGEATYW